MKSIKEIMDAAAAPKNGVVEGSCLFSKKAVFKNGKSGQKPEDVVGFDYTIRDKNGVCWSYYAANPPLTGMSYPAKTECPLGIVCFDHFDIHYEKAIGIVDEMKCGATFTDMTLSWPLTPACKEPLWHFSMDTGQTIVIGADTGDTHCLPPLVTLYGVWPE